MTETKNETRAPEPAPVAFAVHEGAVAFARETITRLWVAVCLLAVLLFLTNAAWLWAWIQYDYASEPVKTVAQRGRKSGKGSDAVEYSNSQMQALIDEYIHNDRDAEILRLRLIRGYTYAAIANAVLPPLTSRNSASRPARGGFFCA